MLLGTEKEAIEYPCHDIELGFCRRCCYIANIRFDPSRLAYSGNYEETQDYSGTFREFQQHLAARLIRRHDMRRKQILEIGCGKGEFLKLLCSEGDNRGTGYDPAYVPERAPGPGSDKTEFIRDFFGPDSGPIEEDMVICKMTLEHIHDPSRFVTMCSWMRPVPQ